MVTTARIQMASETIAVTRTNGISLGHRSTQMGDSSRARSQPLVLYTACRGFEGTQASDSSAAGLMLAPGEFAGIQGGNRAFGKDDSTVRVPREL